MASVLICLQHPRIPQVSYDQIFSDIVHSCKNGCMKQSHQKADHTHQNDISSTSQITKSPKIPPQAHYPDICLDGTYFDRFRPLSFSFKRRGWYIECPGHCGPMDTHQDTVGTPAQRFQTPTQYYSSDLMRTPQYLFRISPRLHTNRLSTRPIFEFCYICQPLFIGFLCCKTSIQDTFRKIFRREILPMRSLFLLHTERRSRIRMSRYTLFRLHLTPYRRSKIICICR